VFLRVGNIVDSLGQAGKSMQKRMVGNFIKADPELGNGVARG
jgi:catalase